MSNEVNETTPSTNSQAPVTAITVNVQDLVALVSATVAQVLAQQPQQSNPLENVGQVIGEAVAEGMRKNTRPKVSVGEYLRKSHTTMHPDPELPNGPKLSRQYYQNGVPIWQHQAKDQEIYLLNQITHSGHYIDRRVQVVVALEGSEEVVYVMFNNKPDAMQDLKTYAKTFVDMLEQIVAQQVIENEEREVEKQLKAEVAARRQRNLAEGKAPEAPVRESHPATTSKAYREAVAARQAKEAAKNA